MFFLQKLTAKQNWSANLAVKWVGGIKYIAFPNLMRYTKILTPESRILNPESWILNPDSWLLKT